MSDSTVYERVEEIPVSSFFPDATVAKPAVIPVDVRAVPGDDSEFLLLPGCVSVTGVRTTFIEIPQFESYEVVRDASGALQWVRERIWQLVEIEGKKGLVRSLRSNHGVWQKGDTFYITGEWDKEEEESSTSSSSSSTLASEPQLQAEVEAHQIKRQKIFGKGPNP